MSVAVAYLRVSTEKQEVDAQRRAIEEFAKTRGFTVLWFTDEAVSGGIRAFERPGFKRMIEFLESNQHVRDIVVFELSRLGRDYDDLKDILHYISNKGYRLWIVTLPTWNELVESTKATDNPLLKLLYKLLADIFVSIMSFAASQERILISMRTRAGLQKARAEGKKLGRPGYPFPVDEIRSLMKKGLPLTKIHKLLIAEKKICREVKGKGEDCMSYETFRRKVKQL
ncbi:MAG: recombinase family protein [Candidatus Bathyarchaeota archaeon]|nr:recombinase family protein [Candidatus Bathyarchaeota archaeon]